MKKIIYILSAGILCLSSCKIVKEYSNGGDSVYPGYVAFEATYMAFVKDMTNASFVLAANDYILGDEAEKEEMRNGVFEDVVIEQSGGEWTFEYPYGGNNETIKYVMDTRGLDLMETGVVWNVVKSDNASNSKKTDSEGKFTIKCTAPESWKMDMEGFRYYNWNRDVGNNAYVTASQTVLDIRRVGFTENSGFQTARYSANGSSAYKSGDERDFKIMSALSGADMVVISEKGFYPFARKKTSSVDIIMTVENRDRRTDEVTAHVSSDNVSVNFRTKRKNYQTPDFTGIPKPAKPKPEPEPVI